MKLSSNQTVCVRVQSIVTPRGQHRTRAESATDAAGHVYGHGVGQQGAISRGTTFNDAGGASFQGSDIHPEPLLNYAGTRSYLKFFLVCR